MRVQVDNTIIDNLTENELKLLKILRECPAMYPLKALLIIKEVLEYTLKASENERAYETELVEDCLETINKHIPTLTMQN